MTTTTTELVPVGEYLPAVAESRTVNTLELVGPAAELANRIAKTNFVPTAYRGKPDELLACFLAGHELDVPPMTSMRLIHIVDGRPTFAAELMRAKVIAAGHELWLEESNANTCTMVGRRREWPADRTTRVTWTMEDAKRAGLANRNNWRAYPADMLLARSTGRLVRATFPEVMAGLAVREEVEDGYLEDLELEAAGDVDTPPADAPPPPAKRTRKATTRKAAAKKAPTTPLPVDGRPPLPAAASPAMTPAPAPTPAGAKPALPAEVTPTDVVEGLEAMAAAQRPPTETPPEPTAEAPNAPPAATTPEEEPVDEVAEARKRRSTAVVLTLKEVGIESDDDRHAFLEWATGGRIASATQVESAELDLVRSVCGRITAGELVLLRDATGTLIVTEPDVAEAELPDEPEFDVDGDGQDDGIAEAEVLEDDDPLDLNDPLELRGWLKGLGIRIPDAIKEAARVAGTIGHNLPASLEDLAQDDEVLTTVIAWAQAKAGA